MAKKSKGHDCDSCVNYVYDDEYGDFVCMADLDEDEVYRLMNYNNFDCPCYRLDDEYAVVRKQN